MRVLRALLCVSLLAATGFAPRAVITVYLVGDSTMADKPNPDANPERGWGQALPPLFDDAVTVRNFAVNGRSSKSFRDEGKWDAVLAQVHKGDYVLIQFGHNDYKPTDPKRHTNPYTGFRRNLERYVADTRAKGATPVLLSSIVYRRFNANGVLEDGHGAYGFMAREVARETKTPFIDLQLMTEDLVIAAGPDSSKALYVNTTAGEFPAFPAERHDDTHLSPRGAAAVARLAALGMKEIALPLAKHLKPIE